MEAVEYGAAEPQASAWHRITMSMGVLADQLPRGIRLIDFAPRFGVRTSAERPVCAVECEDITRGTSVLLPEALVFVPADAVEAGPPFGANTNGLASGNSVEEATLHGLLEVMERDALSMNQPRDATRWIARTQLPEPFRTLESAWREIGIRLAVRFVPNAFALPCFEAWVHEPGSTSVDIASGSGLHLDRDIALARAVCEAAQSRLSHIHGGRDDITRFFGRYDGRAPSGLEESSRLIDQAFDPARKIRFDAVPHEPSRRRSLGKVLDDVLERLSRAGFDTVLRHRFRLELGGLSVVKVVVPRCEVGETDSRRLGPRLLTQIVGHV